VATAGWVEVADIGCLVVVGFGVVVVVVVVGVFGPGVVNAPEVLIPKLARLVQLNGADTSP
jgi:flagellar biosynthesis protein FlhB